MSTKAVLVRRASVERQFTVLIPDGITPHYLVAALNAQSAREIGDFLIFPDTFSARVEKSVTEYGDVSWEVQSADEPSPTVALEGNCETLRATARADAEQAAAAQRRFDFLWRISSLNKMAFACVVDGKHNDARKFVTAASLVYQLSGAGDCDEAVWLLQLKSFNAGSSKKPRAAWRHGKLAIEMARRLHKPGHQTLGMCLSNVGEALLNAGDVARAETLLQEAVQVLDQTLAEGANDAAHVSSSRAEALQNLKRIEESKVYAL